MRAGLQRILAADLAELARLDPDVDRFLARVVAPEAASYAVRLVVEEIVTNVVKYAWRDSGPHTFELSLVLEGSFVKISVVDDGVAFDPLSVAVDGEASEDPGGLGLRLLRKTAQRTVYARREGKNYFDVWVELVANPRPAP